MATWGIAKKHPPCQRDVPHGAVAAVSDHGSPTVGCCPPEAPFSQS